MRRSGGFKTCWVVVLLIAEAMQAITPDIASLASTRLFRITMAFVDSEQSGLSRPHLDLLRIQLENSPPFDRSVPLDDRSRETAPDEVCLASFELALRIPVSQAGEASSPWQFAFNSGLCLPNSGWPLPARVSDPIPSSSMLIHSLCRMTC